jgi:chemotaxis protein MotB
VSSFFNNPTGPGTQTGTDAAGAGHALEVQKDDLSKLKEKIEQALKQMPNFRELKDHVEMTLTSEGLRIELLETEAGIFFESGRPLPTASGADLLKRLAQELGQMKNQVLIEGHTDAKPFGGDGSYSNWELSSDRANAARRLMEAAGIRREQVGQVRGFADRQLRHPDDPESASNRRVSVIVQYLSPPAPPPGEKKAEEKKGEEKKGEEKKGEEKKPSAAEEKKAPPAPEKKAEEKPKAAVH